MFVVVRRVIEQKNGFLTSTFESCCMRNIDALRLIEKEWGSPGRRRRKSRGHDGLKGERNGKALERMRRESEPSRDPELGRSVALMELDGCGERCERTLDSEDLEVLEFV
jgi:hypothetical protein